MSLHPAPGDHLPPFGGDAAFPSFDAACTHAGELNLGMKTPPLSPPIVRASVFAPGDLDALEGAITGAEDHWAYARNANPTVDAFERAVAALECAVRAVAAASGMGAIGSVLLGLCAAGDRVVTTDALYGVTRRLMDEHLGPAGVQVEHRSGPAIAKLVAAGGALPADTRMVYTELVANPMLEVADLDALAVAAHAVGALLVVDATFATPALCRPLSHGADIVIHSATKYLGGHGDLILGVAAGTAETMASVHNTMATLGASADPTAAWLALRGMRTLHLRMERHGANGAAAAAWLDGRPEVTRVWYPGLATHGTHAAAVRMLGGGPPARATDGGSPGTPRSDASDPAPNFGGMVSFELAGGRPAVERFLGGVRLIRLAPSLADVTTTLSYPATTSHRGVGAEVRAAAGITDGVLRLSCGLEAARDVLEDLERGLGAL